MKAISIKQPWAFLILNSGKDIENRSWKTKLRGRVLIHASKSIDEEAVVRFGLEKEFLPTGCMVGTVEIVDCVESEKINSPWNTNSGFCFMLKKPVKITPFKYKGQLNFFKVSEDILK